MLGLVQDNPYAPPTVDQARVAPASRGWSIEDGRLIVEPEAILPMVDPYTGESSERMTAIRLGLQRRVIWPRLLMLGSVLLLFALPAFDLEDGWGIAALLLFLAGLFAWVAIPATLGYVTLFVFVGPRNQNRNRIIRWVTIGLIVLLIGMVVVVPNVPGIDVAVLNLLTFVWTVLAVGLLMVRSRRRRLYWRPTPGGKREMIGVHPLALKLLKKEESSLS